MLSSSNRTLRLVETDQGRAWNWYFLQKEEYCTSPGRLLIESFAKQIKFSSQRSPPFFFFPMISANCSSCIFSASLKSSFAFLLFPGCREHQHWCVATVLSSLHAAALPPPPGLWFGKGFNLQNWH